MRLFTCGLEAGSLTGYFPVTSSVAISSGTSRTGIYSLNLNGVNGFARTGSISTGTVIFGGFAINPATILAGTADILEALDAGGNVLIAIKGMAGGKLGVSRSTTVLATGTATIPTNQWSYIEYYFYVNNSSGTAVVKVDDVIDINFVGDTEPSAIDIIDSVNFIRGSGNPTFYMDDIVINSPAGSNNNTYPGMIRLYPIYPDSAGDVTQLSRGGADIGANWSQVNQVPASFSSYVYSTGTNSYDLYNFQSLSLPVGSQILNVINNISALLDSGAGSIASMVKSGGTESQGSDKALSISEKMYQEVLPTDPSTASAWTPGSINSIQAGAKTR